MSELQRLGHVPKVEALHLAASTLKKANIWNSELAY